MQDAELIELLLASQEWQTFDCKRAAIKPAKLLETAVAFANSDGGLIALGLADPEKVSQADRLTGISENPDNVSEFLKLLDKEIDPSLKLWKKHYLAITNIQNLPDNLLLINIVKSNDVHSLKNGDTYIRKGRQNVKIGSTEIVRLKYEKGALKYEDEPSGVFSLEDIDASLLDTYKRDTQSEGEDGWQFLKDNGLAIKRDAIFQLTRAGALLFAKNPSVLLKIKCGIKISHYYGTAPSFSAKPNFVRRPFSLEGPLPNQIQRALSYFKEVVGASPPSLSGASFSPTLLIPEWAFQEAVTNAVIHRNYSIQDDIQIRFFDDRIEIESPGIYPGHITMNNIRFERFARNPIILRTLSRFKSAPNLDIGEGVDRMFKVMGDSNLYEPLYLPPSIRPNTVLLILLNLQKVAYWDTVSKYLDDHFRITNKEAREITGTKDTIKMSRLLKLWVNKGLLEKVSAGFKGHTYYKKVGVETPMQFEMPFAGGSVHGSPDA